MRVVLTPQFVRAYKTLSASDQRLCNAAVEALPGAFGRPHLHAGLGIRPLRRGLYECRATQAVRVTFTRHGDVLLLHTVGNHDGIRTWLRNNL